jgi:hypothetical protein
MPTVRKYSSRSQQTTLSSAVTSSGTSITVVSAASLLGGVTIAANEVFTIVIDPDTALEEIVDVVSAGGNPVSGNTITIVRGRDGSTGTAHSAGAVVRHMAIGRDYREANDHINENTTAHGLTLADVVKVTDTGTVVSTVLASNSVTTAKITDLNVTTAKIADSAITSAKIADLGIATGDIADSAITSGKIATGAVGTTKIDDLSVTEGKLAPNAVTSAKIADGTIVAGDLADGAVTSAKILDGTIVNADINASAAIDKTKISGTAITAGDTGTVTSTMILDGTIANADVSATAAIAKTKLDLGGTITSADIVDGTIVASDIADGTITAAKLVSDPYARANHTGTQTASTVSDFNTAVRTNRLDQMAAPTASVALNAQKITGLATPTDNTDASTKAYVDAQVNALVDGAPGTLNTLNEIATAISSGGSFESTVVLKSGSTMTGALTLSGAPTVDLHAATKAYVDTVAGSATAAAASATAAAESYDNFDDRYLGAKATAPTLDNDGNALITGAIYWNSVSNAMFVWSGSAWGSISSTADIFRFRYTAAGGETSESGLDDNGITLSYLPGKEQVYLNGVLLVRTTDYTASDGTSITSLAALTAGDILEIITFTAFDLATAIDKALFDAKGDILVATAADTPGKLTVGTNGQVLNADSSTATGLAWVTPAAGYSAPTLGSTSIASGATVTTVAGLTLTSPVLTTPTISTVDAKGDLLAGTADNTVARLAVGANNTVLTADSSTATGLKWATPAAGSITEITSGTLDVASTTLSSITGAYKNLILVLNNIRDNTDTNYIPRMRLNGDTASNYVWKLTSSSTSGAASTFFNLGEATNQSASANGAILYVELLNYSNTSMSKLMQTTGTVYQNTSSLTQAIGSYKSNTAITSITIFPSGGTNPMLGTYILYGVN